VDAIRGRGSVKLELRTLSDVLPFLLARDDERPAAWVSTLFSERLEAARGRLASVDHRRELVARFAGVSSNTSSPDARLFGHAARRLASDPIAVAFAIRLREIEAHRPLPSWPELLRRPRSPLPRPPAVTRDDGAIWFG